jgi:aerobic-type carbon monoxide dehydrogenase small subunit (CoxS/CutS family)
MPFKLNINKKDYTVEVSPDTPLLWVLRDSLGLTGTKYSCGTGQCGACTVHQDGEPVRSCTLEVSAVKDTKITTIEGLSPDGTHPLQVACWEESVPQCGYCQPGQIMTAAALLAKTPNPTDRAINDSMAGVLCRCGTYQRIHRAIRRAAEKGGAK